MLRCPQLETLNIPTSYLKIMTETTLEKHRFQTAVHCLKTRCFKCMLFFRAYCCGLNTRWDLMTFDLIRNDSWCRLLCIWLRHWFTGPCVCCQVIFPYPIHFIPPRPLTFLRGAISQPIKIITSEETRPRKRQPSSDIQRLCICIHGSSPFEFPLYWPEN